VTRADVLSYRGNGWPQRQTKHSEASSPSSLHWFHLDLPASHPRQLQEEIAFDFLTVVCFTTTAPTSLTPA
jgi:hypothetical protein